jgi:hypothetical protein
MILIINSGRSYGQQSSMIYNEDGSTFKRFVGSHDYFFNVHTWSLNNITVKTDTLYNIIWAKSYSSEAHLVSVGIDNSLYLINSDTCLIKTDSSGNILWVKKFGSPAFFSSGVSGHLLSRSILTGAYTFGDKILVTLSQHDLISSPWEFSSVIALDTAGNYLWAVGDSTGPFAVTDIHQSIDSGFWLCGSVRTSSSSNKSAGVVRISGNGTVYFRRLLATLSNGYILSMHTLPDSTYFIITNSYTIGAQEFNVFRVREDGESVFNYNFYLDTTVSNPNNAAEESALDPNNNLYVSGFIDSQWYFARIDSLCNLQYSVGWTDMSLYTFYTNTLVFNNGQLNQTLLYHPGAPHYAVLETLDTLGNAACFSTDTTLVLYKKNSTAFTFQNDTTWCSINYTPLIGSATSTNETHAFFEDFCQFVNAPDMYVNRNVTCYPNPVSDGSFTVDFYSAQSGDFQLEVNDLSGRLLIRRELNATVGFNQMRITTDLVKGIYIATLHGCKFSAPFKIMIQN